jgi:NAD dependent epimerase/dehydratase family enzyme
VHTTKRILISGSHGLVGSALVKSLATEGHEVVRLVRHGGAAGSAEVAWHPEKGVIDGERLEGLDAVVHLAGESIAAGRWTSEKKRAILESRVKGTTLLSQSLAKLSRPPAVFVSARRLDITATAATNNLQSKARPAQAFSPTFAVSGRNATTPASEKGIRTVLARFGIHSRREWRRASTNVDAVSSWYWWSCRRWQTVDELGRTRRRRQCIRFSIYDNFISGPVNIVAPFPVTNAEFTKTLGSVLRRPTILPIPGFSVRLAFGEMGDALLLSSQRVEQAVLKARGYSSQLAQAGTHLTKTSSQGVSVRL